jgi:hypothetical protein
MAADRGTAVIEKAIREHHVVLIDYTDRNEKRSTIEAEPYAYKRAHNGQLELWIYALVPDHWEALHPDRIHGVQDTGRPFVWRDVLPAELREP